MYIGFREIDFQQDQTRIFEEPDVFFDIGEGFHIKNVPADPISTMLAGYGHVDVGGVEANLTGMYLAISDRRVALAAVRGTYGGEKFDLERQANVFVAEIPIEGITHVGKSSASTGMFGKAKPSRELVVCLIPHLTIRLRAERQDGPSGGEKVEDVSPIVDQLIEMCLSRRSPEDSLARKQEGWTTMRNTELFPVGIII